MVGKRATDAISFPLDAMSLEHVCARDAFFDELDVILHLSPPRECLKNSVSPTACRALLGGAKNEDSRSVPLFVLCAAHGKRTQ